MDIECFPAISRNDVPIARALSIAALSELAQARHVLGIRFL
jgi:hypothetical protein